MAKEVTALKLLSVAKDWLDTLGHWPQLPILARLDTLGHWPQLTKVGRYTVTKMTKSYPLLSPLEQAIVRYKASWFAGWRPAGNDCHGQAVDHRTPPKYRCSCGYTSDQYGFHTNWPVPRSDQYGDRVWEDWTAADIRDSNNLVKAIGSAHGYRVVNIHSHPTKVGWVCEFVIVEPDGKRTTGEIGVGNLFSEAVISALAQLYDKVADEQVEPPEIEPGDPR